MSAILTVGGILTGCRDSSVLPTGTSKPRSASLSAQQISHQHPGEAVFEQISNEVPSFAGFFFEGGKLVALVSDTSQALPVEAVVRRVMADPAQTSAHPQLLNSVLVVRPATFSFRQLRQWRDQIELQVVPDLPDIASIYVDESRNQVAIGLADGSGRGALESALAGLGVPGQGVRIETTGRVAPDVSLRDSVRPVVGGLQTEYTARDTNWRCTLGVNATYNGTNVILTASHCSAQMYQNDSTPTAYYQNLISATRRIGAEWFDPPAIGAGCTIGGVYHLHCHRNSDALMIRYDSGVAFDLGYIARTTFASATWGDTGSVTIDVSNPRFRITSALDYGYMGEYVEKVGRTTGWTIGPITAMCVDDHATDGWWRDCSYYATYYSGGGDSGSPVFWWLIGGASDVELVGIHWGFNSQSHYSAYSTWGGIHSDFGGISPLVPGLPPPDLSVDIIGPHSVPAAFTPVCYYQGVVLSQDGTPPYYYDWYVNDEWVTNGDQLDYGGPNSFKLTLQVHDSGVPVRTGSRWWQIYAYGDSCGT